MTGVYAQSTMMKNEIKLLRLHQNKLAPCRSGTRWIEMFGGLAFFFSTTQNKDFTSVSFSVWVIFLRLLRSWIEPLEKARVLPSDSCHQHGGVWSLRAETRATE